MAKCTIKINTAGLDEFLNSEQVEDMLIYAASNVLAKLGDGYAIQKTYHGPHRANVAIETITERAYWDNVRNNTMLKALGGKP